MIKILPIYLKFGVMKLQKDGLEVTMCIKVSNMDTIVQSM